MIGVYGRIKGLQSVTKGGICGSVEVDPDTI
jgi:hypothetical protein